MKRNHIELVVSVNRDEFDQQIEMTQRVFREFGLTVADASASLTVLGPVIADVWREVMSDLAEVQHQSAVEMLFMANSLDCLGLSLEEYFAPIRERQAQQRAQMVLFAVFVLVMLIILLAAGQ